MNHDFELIFSKLSSMVINMKHTYKIGKLRVKLLYLTCDLCQGQSGGFKWVNVVKLTHGECVASL